jgi:hypothetical protein
VDCTDRTGRGHSDTSAQTHLNSMIRRSGRRRSARRAPQPAFARADSCHCPPQAQDITDAGHRVWHCPQAAQPAEMPESMWSRKSTRSSRAPHSISKQYFGDSGRRHPRRQPADRPPPRSARPDAPGSRRSRPNGSCPPPTVTPLPRLGLPQRTPTARHQLRDLVLHRTRSSSTPPDPHLHRAAATRSTPSPATQQLGRDLRLNRAAMKTTRLAGEGHGACCWSSLIHQSRDRRATQPTPAKGCLNAQVGHA